MHGMGLQNGPSCPIILNFEKYCDNGYFLKYFLYLKNYFLYYYIKIILKMGLQNRPSCPIVLNFKKVL